MAIGATWETKVLIANHLEIGNRSQIIFITLLLQVLGFFAVRFTSPQQTLQKCLGQASIFELLLHPILICSITY